VTTLTWVVEGTYLESCNCEAICPCRRVGGVPGGRSTHGICMGALSWRIERGNADGLDLGGLAVALVCRYDDDEPGSPWRFTLHVDDRAGEEQRAALTGIFLGRSGGGPRVQGLPWVRKPATLLAVESSRIELEHRSERRFLRVADRVTLTIRGPVETDQTVSCIVPGHDRQGMELYAEELRVDDGAFEAEFRGNCAFTSGFSYRSDE
jgi:hypothetical protein